jgi:hypothetical protein
MDQILTPTVVRVFRALGVIGLAASAAVHVSTFLGLVPGPGFFALHAAVFVVFFPAVLVSRRDRLSLSWSNIAAPAWAKVGVILLFVYAAFNASRFFAENPGTVAERDGKLVVHDHGRNVRTIDRAEADRIQALDVRGFSGHWMALFAAGALLLHSSLSSRRGEQADAPPPVDGE